jgi:hypothetical protein
MDHNITLHTLQGMMPPFFSVILCNKKGKFYEVVPPHILNFTFEVEKYVFKASLK